MGKSSNIACWHARCREFCNYHFIQQNTAKMNKDSKVVIIGAGIFGLSTAYQLALEGYRNVVVVDRHMPPVSHSHLI
jgi:threonine dehydrogenase-like Zn-dependent dehydrogenase